MAGKNIDDAFAAIIEACRESAVVAVKNAAKKAQDDIIRKANSTLNQYYKNYKPKKYQRSYNLHKSIKPICVDNSTANKVSMQIGVEYDPGLLKGLYHSNSWYHQEGEKWRSVPYAQWGEDKNLLKEIGQDNGIPEPEWIVDNFLAGIHPWAQKDPISPMDLMNDFFDTQLNGRVIKYIENEWYNAIIRRL